MCPRALPSTQADLLAHRSQYALTEIKGVGRRYANLVCKKADVDLTKRCASTSLVSPA